MLRKIVSGIILLLLANMLILTFNIQLVKAEEPALINVLHTLGFVSIAETYVETFPAGFYEVTLYAEFAAYNPYNELSWYKVGTIEYNLLFSGPEGNFGYITPPIIKTFTANSDFGLSFLSPEARYFTEIARNPDGIKHAMMFINLNDPTMLLIGWENLLGGGDRDYQDMVISLKLIKSALIEATIDIDPNTLNLRSKGKWITAYIELPEGYNVADINVSSIMLNNTIPVEPKPMAVGDYDNDSIPDLMVKFDRAEVISYILANIDLTELIEERFMTITLTIIGYLYDGTPFQGRTAIKIIMPMPRCWRFIKTLEVYPI